MIVAEKDIATAGMPGAHPGSFCAVFAGYWIQIDPASRRIRHDHQTREMFPSGFFPESGFRAGSRIRKIEVISLRIVKTVPFPVVGIGGGGRFSRGTYIFGVLSVFGFASASAVHEIFTTLFRPIAIHRAGVGGGIIGLESTGYAQRIEFIAVIGIKEKHFSGRGKIIGARDLLGTLLGLVQRGEQHARQNRDNSNDHDYI